MSQRPPVWDRAAKAQWLRLSFEDAERVARAVEQWNATGQCDGVVLTLGGVCYMFVGKHVVMFYVGEVMRVVAVRRA